MEFQINSTTGAQEASFGAKLLSISEKTLVNSNGKDYKVGSIEFKNINGETCRTSAFIYKGNYDYGMEIGETYLTRATAGDKGGVLINVSHLVYGGQRATEDMFGFEEIAADRKVIVETASTF